MSKYKRVQTGQVSHGNFHEKTLTFQMDDGFYISGGSYALVKIDDFQKLKRALINCKMALQAHQEDSENSEFQGSVSLADEVLTEIEL